MDTLVLQLGVRFGRLADVVRTTGEAITIGRSFTNDVVLTDVHIAPHQLQIYRESGRWFAEILDATNPVLLNGELISQAKIPLNSGDKLTLGRMQFGIYSSTHPVEATRRLFLTGWFQRLSKGFVIPLLILLVISIADMLFNFYTVSTTLEWGLFAAATLGSTIIIIAWAGAWALIGRIFRHQANFGAQLLATALVAGASSMLVPMLGILEFNLGTPYVSYLGGYLLAVLLIAVLLRANLYHATAIKSPAVVAGIVSVSLALVVQGFEHFGNEGFNYQPVYSTVMKPPITRLAPSTSIEVYFDKLDRTLVFGEKDLK